ncbi:MAG TPA: FtsH protease activity modulator HflK, partial [Parvularculaceae bacterium]|nr:FtsH protease activity modulator HflK [Parvularculaceae bacterium]
RGEPPDLEELLNASRQRLKRAFPRGGGGSGGRGGGRVFNLGPRAFPLVLIGVIVLWLLTGVYQVGPQEQGVQTTFGKYTGITGPGLHWRAPIMQQVYKVPVDIQQRATLGDSSSGRGGENLMLTSDRNIVDVNFTVDWKISRAPPQQGEMPNAAKFIFNIEDPKAMVTAVSEAAMRETIGAKQLEPIITSGQADVVEQTRQRIQEVLDEYNSGIEVLRVNMDKPDVPGAVRDAFADVIKARNEKTQMINEAQRDANQIIPVAEGDAQRAIQEAQAYAAQIEADAVGEANRFDQIFAEYRRAKDVTKRRMYLETMEKVLGGVDKVVVDESATKSGVVPYLPLDKLNKGPAQPKNTEAGPNG